MFEQKTEGHNKNVKMALKMNMEKTGRQSAPLGFKLAALQKRYWSFDHNFMAKKGMNIENSVIFLQ